MALPISFVNEHTVLVAMADPSNIVAIDDLRILTGFDIEPAVADAEDITAALVEAQGLRRSGHRTLALRGSDGEEEVGHDELRDIREQVDAAPVVKLVNGILARAADEGASDIHFEPQAKEMLVRFRHDGVLHETMTIPKRLQAGVISRLKIMADLDIAERRVPQDGRIGLTVGGRPIDMRVAALPTVYGEKIVIRLLDRSNVMLRLEELGFSDRRWPATGGRSRSPMGPSWSRVRPARASPLHSMPLSTSSTRREEHHHSRGPRGVSARGDQSGSDQSQSRLDLRLGPAVDPALRPRYHHGGRDPRQGNGSDRGGIRAYRPPSAVHVAHERCSRRADPAHRDGCRAFLTASAVDCVIAQRLVRKLCDRARSPISRPQELLQASDFRKRSSTDGETSRSFTPSVAVAAAAPATKDGWASTRSCLSPRRSSG